MKSDSLEPAYLLHSRRYRNTSALLELFTANRGRLGAVARGLYGKGASAQIQRGQMQLGTALLVSLAGRSDLKQLRHFESVAGDLPDMPPRLWPAPSQALYCVMYLNELLVRLLPPQFPCPALFAAYQAALSTLGGGQRVEPVLRCFEMQLLDTLGYGIDFSVEAATHRPIEAHVSYRYVAGAGFYVVRSDDAVDRFSGLELIAMGQGDFTDANVLRASKRLMRQAIAHQLGGRPLNSRALFEAQSNGR